MKTHLSALRSKRSAESHDLSNIGKSRAFRKLNVAILVVSGTLMQLRHRHFAQPSAAERGVEKLAE
jgi:hypothetical protein